VRAWGAGCLAVSIFVAAPALAQSTIAADEWSSLSYRPAPSPLDYVMVDGARIGDFALPIVSLHFEHAIRPLEIGTQCAIRAEISCDVNPERAAIVRALTLFHLVGAWAPNERIELALHIPIGGADGEGIDYRGSPIRPGGSAGLADPRISGKVWLFGDAERDGYAVSALLWLTLPLGQATANGRYIGDDHPAFGGHAIGELFVNERLRLALNLGGYYRPVRRVVGTEVGPMVYYALAGEYLFTDPAGLVGVTGLLEVTGSTLFANVARIDQLEGRIAGRVRWEWLYGDVGFGVGFILGPGVPDLRILLGVGVALEPEGDMDGDGLLDSQDSCPDKREDTDGFADDDGCPEPDNDGDGLRDARDRCPDEAEDPDEHEDEDGCPEPDNDGDGIADGWDSCPDTPEDTDGDRDNDGCPESDQDGDGIDDNFDECPRQAEDTDGLGDADGCPERDHDGDNIPDDRDECPEDAEDRDRFEDRDGCPEPGGRIDARPESELSEHPVE
jgi:hypothetical protein